MVKRLSVFSFDDHTAILSGFLAFQPYFLPGSKFYLPQQREVAVLDYREIGPAASFIFRSNVKWLCSITAKSAACM